MGSGTPARRLTAQARREQLLDTAVLLAGDGDLSAVSVQEIALRASVSEGLLYHYFPSKDALLLAAVERAAARMLAALELALEGSPDDPLGAALGAYLDHVQQDSAGWRALLGARSGPLAQVAAQVEQWSRAATLRLLGVDDPPPALLAAVDGWAALERQVCLVWLDAEDLSREVVEELLTSSFSAVLAAVQEHDPRTRALLGPPA